MSSWCQDLKDYYGVTEIQALALRGRGTKVKHRYPASATIESCTDDMTGSQLWDSKPRETVQQKMDFYKELGQRTVFRQVFYRRKYNYSIYLPYVQSATTIVEYGCGVATFTKFLSKNIDIKNKRFIIVDVPGEHLEFAKFRLRNKIPKDQLIVHEISPTYYFPYKNLDFVLLLDVLEHITNPLEVLHTIKDNMNINGHLAETWIDLAGKGSRENLQEAADEREQGLLMLKKEMTLVEELDILEPTRIYKKT